MTEFVMIDSICRMTCGCKRLDYISLSTRAREHTERERESSEKILKRIEIASYIDQRDITQKCKY